MGIAPHVGERNLNDVKIQGVLLSLELSWRMCSQNCSDSEGHRQDLGLLGRVGRVLQPSGGRCSRKVQLGSENKLSLERAEVGRSRPLLGGPYRAVFTETPPGGN